MALSAYVGIMSESKVEASRADNVFDHAHRRGCAHKK